ncbi:Basic-leucine zipper transcription factor [Parasponia andersonii]|uniref:Basic-leucine zipper transcription factor n=1 Tax=Parasponia andersonii TaxID=3476 RepID=A0A2P5B113_PARAD|nr:Basic-leucine zipper transcription factor [Parasponia andersonii]
MVAPEPEATSQGEVESSLQSNYQQQRNHPLSSLGRQSSIYSLTLDEFQHTLCESGKNFGSMNMDEFLTSIWTAEENQAINSNHTPNKNNSNNNHNNNNSNIIDHGGGATSDHLALSEVSAEKGGGIARQQSLTRQGSLTLPGPLCRKTVEEPTFGEMTLEDFLIKAGVVREPSPLAVVAAAAALSQQQPPPQQQYGMYHSNSAGAGSSFVNRAAALGIGGGSGSGAGMSGAAAGGVAGYQAMQQASTAALGESSVYAGNGGRNGSYPQPPPPPPPPPPAICYGGRVVNGGGGYAAGQATLGPPAPVSPVSSDGICGNQVDNSGNQYGLDMGALRGRKRIIDGPVEKVVERRQRRMIKNRESAARSRARKQAYTVELEAELNQLREENAHLKQALAELERKQKQQYFEEMKMKVQTRAYKAKEKLIVFRRNLSCPL